MPSGGNGEGHHRIWSLPVFRIVRQGEDYYIPWDCVQKFGDDIVLIDKPFQRRDGPPNQKKRRKF